MSSSVSLNMDKSNFFVDFKSEFVDNTIFNSFNQIHDEIQWNNKSDFSKFTAIPKIGDSKLLETIKYIYENKCSAQTVKEYAMKHEDFGELLVSREEFLKLYDEASESEQAFLNFLFVSPKLVYNYYSKKYAKCVIPNCFSIYVMEMLAHPSTKCLFGSLSLIDILTNTAIISSLTNDLCVADIENAEMFWNQIEIISFGKLTGHKKVSSFNQAFRIMQRIAPVWSQLKISSDTMNDDETYGQTDVDSEPNVDEVVNVFQGNYALVPASYPQCSRVCLGLVSNFANFNKLSKNRKLQVSNYLLNNRAKFNSIITDSCKIISDSIARDCDNFTQFASTGNSAQDSVVSSAAGFIRKSFQEVRNKDTRTKTNYIVSCFLPIVTKFKSELMNATNYNQNNYQNILENLNSGLQMLGGGIYDDDSSMQLTPMVGGYSEMINVPVRSSYSVEQYRNDLRKAQIEFNRKYENFYREFVTRIEQVKLPNVYSLTINKLYPLCRIFGDIAIKDPKTTVYLSGLYGKRNRNNAYKRVVEETIRTIKDSGVSCFNDVANSLETLVKLLNDSDKTAKDLRAKFVSSPRATSDDMIGGHEKIKVPCNLNARDFTAFDSALNNLFWQLRNNTSESNILNNKAELSKYIENAKNRDALIRERFALKDQQLNYYAQQIKDVALLNKFVKAKKAINSALLNSCLYVNNIVETHLTKDKIEAVQTSPISKKQLEKIESSFLLFKRAKMSARYQDEFKKLNEMFKKNEDIFTITNQFVKIIAASRYVDFISGLYRDLGLISGDFNWEEFNFKITSFMVLNSLDVNVEYLFDNKQPMTVRQYVNKLIIETAKQNDMTDLFGVLQNEVYRYIRFTDKIDFPIEEIDVDGYNLNYQNDDTKDTAITRNIMNSINKSVGARIAINYANGIKTLVQRLSEFVSSKHQISNNLFTTSLSVDIKNYSEEMDTDSKNNDTIINAIFDSLLLNVINIVDKYWGIRYSGNLDLPMNVSQLMRGGSVFDTKEFHDISTSQVIPEAVPFYITALNVCYYYINKLKETSPENENHKISQQLKISDISPLYPVYDIFKNYSATVSSLSLNQLVICVGVFNEIWNQTNGTNEQKLSASIDLLLNELNASIFIHSKYQDSYQKFAYGTAGQFSLTFMEDMDAVIDMIKDIYKSAAIQSFNHNSPEEEQIGFERLMREAYVKIKNVQESQRMTELRYLLSQEPNENIRYYEYYKFMDFIIAPLIVCYRSYEILFDEFSALLNHYKSEIDETIDLKTFVIPNANGTTTNLWDFINRPTVTDLEIEQVVKYHPAVAAWNMMEKSKMFIGLITGKLYTPRFWIPEHRNSQPIQPTNTMKFSGRNLVLKSSIKLREVYPEIHGRKFSDYFEVCMKEFCSDVDQILHLLMSYPGLSDKSISAITTYLHNKLSYPKLESSPAVAEAMRIFNDIPVTQMNTFEFGAPDNVIDIPYCHDEAEVIPGIHFEKFTGAVDNELPNNSVYWQVGQYYRNNYNDRGLLGARNLVMMTSTFGKNNRYFIPTEIIADGSTIRLFCKETDVFKQTSTGMKSCKALISNVPKIGIRYTFTDYVIYQLASLHPEFKLPYKLAAMLNTDGTLSSVVKPMFSQNDVINYSANSFNGYVLNLATQNIIRRSFMASNKALTDYAQFGQESVNRLVASIPYYINKLMTIHNNVDVNVVYEGLNVAVESAALINILQQFYAEISKYITPMKFMQNDQIVRDHVFGELAYRMKQDVPQLSCLELEWANKYKFTNLPITFPDFKNVDSFEFIHKFGELVFAHPIFKQNFEVIIKNMGRHAWNAKIVIDDRHLFNYSHLYILNDNTVSNICNMCVNSIFSAAFNGKSIVNAIDINELLEQLHRTGFSDIPVRAPVVPTDNYVNNLLGGNFPDPDAPPSNNGETSVGVKFSDNVMVGGYNDNDIKAFNAALKTCSNYLSVNNMLNVFQKLHVINKEYKELTNRDTFVRSEIRNIILSNEVHSAIRDTLRDIHDELTRDQGQQSICSKLDNALLANNKAFASIVEDEFIKPKIKEQIDKILPKFKGTQATPDEIFQVIVTEDAFELESRMLTSISLYTRIHWIVNSRHLLDSLQHSLVTGKKFRDFVIYNVLQLHDVAANYYLNGNLNGLIETNANIYKYIAFIQNFVRIRYDLSSNSNDGYILQADAVNTELVPFLSKLSQLKDYYGVENERDFWSPLVCDVGVKYLDYLIGEFTNDYGIIYDQNQHAYTLNNAYPWANPQRNMVEDFEKLALSTATIVHMVEYTNNANNIAVTYSMHNIYTEIYNHLNQATQPLFRQYWGNFVNMFAFYHNYQQQNGNNALAAAFQELSLNINNYFLNIVNIRKYVDNTVIPDVAKNYPEAKQLKINVPKRTPMYRKLSGGFSDKEIDQMSKSEKLTVVTIGGKLMKDIVDFAREVFGFDDANKTLRIRCNTDVVQINNWNDVNVMLNADNTVIRSINADIVEQYPIIKNWINMLQSVISARVINANKANQTLKIYNNPNNQRNFPNVNSRLDLIIPWLMLLIQRNDLIPTKYSKRAAELTKLMYYFCKLATEYTHLDYNVEVPDSVWYLSTYEYLQGDNVKKNLATTDFKSQFAHNYAVYDGVMNLIPIFISFNKIVDNVRINIPSYPYLGNGNNAHQLLDTAANINGVWKHVTLPDICAEYLAANTINIPMYLSSYKYDVTVPEYINVPINKTYKWEDVRQILVKPSDNVNVKNDHAMIVRYFRQSLTDAQRTQQNLNNLNLVWLDASVGDTLPATIGGTDKYQQIQSLYNISVDSRNNYGTIIYEYSVKHIFSDIIGKNIDDFFNVNIDINESSGFLSPKMTGGDPVIMEFVGQSNDLRPINVLNDLYKNQYIPYKVFTYLFNNGSYFKYTDSSDIFHASMNYFRKFNIGMTSVFNNFCYSELIYNKIVFEAIVKKFANVIDRMSLNSDLKAQFALLINYLTNVVSDDKLIWNFDSDKIKFASAIAKYPNSQVRSNVFKPEEFNNKIGNHANIIDKFQKYVNIYQAPSLNNNYMVELTHGIDNCFEKYVNCAPFFNSITFKELRQIDIKCTYISMLVLLLKHTSYYDASSETDMPFFESTLPEPFDAL